MPVTMQAEAVDGVRWVGRPDVLMTSEGRPNEVDGQLEGENSVFELRRRGYLSQFIALDERCMHLASCLLLL